MEPVEKRKAAPPYVAYRTLSNFIDRFKQGVPGRIDRGLMASMSGAAQSQVTTALRFLGMISEHGIPTRAMREYVSGEEAEQKALLATILTGAYPFIFGEGFDLATATSSQLHEAFEANTSATGETLDRCMAFFKEAAADAGLIVSPYITQKKPRSPVKRRPPAPRKDNSRVAEKAKDERSVTTTQYSSAAAQESMLLWGLFQKLPKPRTVWPKSDREQWVQTLQNVLLLEYPESDGY